MVVYPVDRHFFGAAEFGSLSRRHVISFWSHHWVICVITKLHAHGAGFSDLLTLPLYSFSITGSLGFEWRDEIALPSLDRIGWSYWPGPGTFIFSSKVWSFSLPKIREDNVLSLYSGLYAPGPGKSDFLKKQEDVFFYITNTIHLQCRKKTLAFELFTWRTHPLKCKCWKRALLFCLQMWVCFRSRTWLSAGDLFLVCHNMGDLSSV